MTGVAGAQLCYDGPGQDQDGRMIRDSRLYGLLLLQAVLSFMSVIYGIEFHIPLAWRGLVYRCACAVFLTGLSAIAALVPAGKPDPRFTLRTGGLTAWLCLWQLCLSLFFNLKSWVAVGAIAFVLAGGWALSRRLGYLATVAAALAAGFVLFAGTLLLIPPNHFAADMLPVIEHAIDVFRAGGDPYAADYSSVTPNPFFYTPGQWLVFLPPRLAGWDIRVVNIGAALLMVLVTERAVRHTDPAIRSAVYPIMLSPLAVPMMYAGQVWPYWLCMLMFALLILHEKWLSAAAIVAVACDIRPTALVPAAAVFTAAWTIKRFRTMVLAGLAGILVLGLCSVPFAPHLADWHLMFVSGPARALELARQQGNPGNQIALSNIMGWLGLGRFDVVMEALLGLGTIGLAWIAARRGPGPLLAISGLGYMVVISANPYLHRYYYVAGMLLCAVGLTSGKVATSRPA